MKFLKKNTTKLEKITELNGQSEDLKVSGLDSFHKNVTYLI